MHLDEVAWQEVEATGGTVTVLALDEHGQPGTDPRVLPQSGGPVGPIPIQRAFGASHLDMAKDLRHAMLEERWPVGITKGPGWEVPVFLGNPPTALVGMS